MKVIHQNFQITQIICLVFFAVQSCKTPGTSGMKHANSANENSTCAIKPEQSDSSEPVTESALLANLRETAKCNNQDFETLLKEYDGPAADKAVVIQKLNSRETLNNTALQNGDDISPSRTSDLYKCAYDYQGDYIIRRSISQSWARSAAWSVCKRKEFWSNYKYGTNFRCQFLGCQSLL